MFELANRRIVLGITGGVAAYKAVELLRLLVKAGASVDVVVTEAGLRFVGAATFQAISGRAVYHSLWESNASNAMLHIDLTRGADLCVVAPATADFLAKLSCGMADDLLTTLCLARNVPLLVVPAMNTHMWANPATQRNVAQLISDGIEISGPADGEQACGETGMGHIIEVATLYDDIIKIMQPKRLKNRKVLITAGPTFEAIDTVRGFTNLSSGRMGFSLAKAFWEEGAKVTIVAGPITLPKLSGVERLDVITAQQMYDTVMERITEFDIFVSCAAVSDYRPKKVLSQKLKRDGLPLQLEMVSNPDILSAVAKSAQAPFCVGFAAESENLFENARKKRIAKGVPLLVGNYIQHALGGDMTEATLFSATGEYEISRAEKIIVARKIVDHIYHMLAK